MHLNQMPTVEELQRSAADLIQIQAQVNDKH